MYRVHECVKSLNDEKIGFIADGCYGFVVCVGCGA